VTIEPGSTLRQKLDFLAGAGAAQLGHSDHDLLSHLRSTLELLERWGARPAVQDAGLFHSVYGTETFCSAIVDFGSRARVRELIGPEAEQLAYLFGAMTSSSLRQNLGRTGAFAIFDQRADTWLALRPQQLRDLCDITVANWREQLHRVPRELREGDAARYLQMLPLLLPRARAAVLAAQWLR
jgi:hypothetical protein